MGMKLFDDGGDDDIDKISKIEINKEFAKRYEHNKKREDLQRLEELKKKGLAESDSESETESETESDDDVDSRKEAKFFDALLKVRNKDPILQEKDAKLFESSSDDEDEEEEGGERKEKRKKKAKYLKDVIAEQLIEKGAEFGGEEEEEEERERKKVKSYAEEQEEFRRKVLDEMAAVERENEEEDGGEGFLKVKENEGESESDEEVNKRLDEYFGEDDKLDENDIFLKKFFEKKMWIDREKGKNKVVDDDDFVGFSDDEEAIEKQEDYERDYNFRFEENVSDRVLGHSRVVKDSVRKETKARKLQRERKKERMTQAEMERQEEVKRLKNLKRKEIQEKLNKIRAIAGVDEGSIALNEDDLEEDFDPEKYDKKMNAAFGMGYYEAEDVDPEFGNENESDLEKPDFDKEDELLGLPKDWDVIKSSDGFLAEREKIKKGKMENGSEVDRVLEGEANDEELDKGQRKRKRKKSSIKEALDKDLEEELYKLDYEDAIGDLKTRFKYKQVKPSKYGLTSAEILNLDEKELNQYVSLKKLATYREKEWKVPLSCKRLLYDRAFSQKTNQKRGKRKDGDGYNGRKSMEVVKAHGEEQSVDESKLSRAARRRRRMKEKKLPASRLMAYGKMPPSSKKKSKS